MSQFINTVVNNRPLFMQGVEDRTMRRRKRLELIRRAGNIKRNESGTYSRHQIKVTKPPISGYVPGQTLSFSNNAANRYIHLPWRGLITTDTLDFMSFAQNQGEAQLINTYQDKSNDMMSAMDEGFHAVSLGDGDAGAQGIPHGLETFLAYTACTAADRIATPNDSYGDATTGGSLSTVLAALGGDWDDSGGTQPNATLAKDYPDGSGGREYDANSPLFVNFASTNWGTGSAAWRTNCHRVITQAITWMNVNAADSQPTNVSMSKDMWQGYKDSLEPLRRVTVPASQSANYGFGDDTLNLDGTTLHCEFDIPNGTAYVENMRHVEICTLLPNIFWTLHSFDQVGGNIQSFLNMMDLRLLGMLMVSGFFGQFRYKPKYVCKIADLTS